MAAVLVTKREIMGPDGGKNFVRSSAPRTILRCWPAPAGFREGAMVEPRELARELRRAHRAPGAHRNGITPATWDRTDSSVNGGRAAKPVVVPPRVHPRDARARSRGR